MTKWVTKKLGEIGRVVSGLTYSPNNVVNDGVLVLRSSNIQNDNICLEDNVYVNVTEYNPVQEGDVLICVRNGSRALIGKTARINKDIEGCAFGAFMAIYRSEYNDFLYPFFKSDNFFSQVSRNIGATINSINGSDLKNMEVVFPIQADGTPDLTEQKRIASILSSADNVIATSETLIEKYKSIKQGMLTDLLTPKKGWKKVKLGECLTIGNGQDYKHLHKGDIPVYGTGGVMTYVDDYLFDGETVCIGRKGTINKPIFHCGKIWTVDTLFYTHSYVNVLPLFMYYAFCCIDWLRYNEATGVPSLSKETIYKIEINIPEDLTEQRRIAEILSSVDAKIVAEEKVVEKYKGVKKGLMEEMMKK